MKDSYAVRPVASQDAEAWARLRHALWPEGSLAEHRAETERFLSRPGVVEEEVLLAVAEDGRVLGFVELSIRNIVNACAPGRVGYLEGWYMIPEARRQGIGRTLVAAGERWAREQGCREFGSDADLENETSHAAHRRLGFSETGRVVTYRKEI